MQLLVVAAALSASIACLAIGGITVRRRGLSFRAFGVVLWLSVAVAHLGIVGALAISWWVSPMTLALVIAPVAAALPMSIWLATHLLPKAQGTLGPRRGWRPATIRVSADGRRALRRSLLWAFAVPCLGGIEVAAVSLRAPSPLLELILVGASGLVVVCAVRVYRDVATWMSAVGEARDEAWPSAGNRD